MLSMYSVALVEGGRSWTCSGSLTVGLILFCLWGQQQRLTELESSSGTFITPPLVVASLVVPVRTMNNISHDESLAIWCKVLKLFGAPANINHPWQDAGGEKDVSLKPPLDWCFSKNFSNSEYTDYFNVMATLYRQSLFAIPTLLGPTSSLFD